MEKLTKSIDKKENKIPKTAILFPITSIPLKASKWIITDSDLVINFTQAIIKASKKTATLAIKTQRRYWSLNIF